MLGKYKDLQKDKQSARIDHIPSLCRFVKTISNLRAKSRAEDNWVVLRED